MFARGIGGRMSGRRLFGSTVPGAANPLTIFGAANVLQWVNGSLGTVSSANWSDLSGNGKDYTSGTGPSVAVDATLGGLTTVQFNGTTHSMASGLVLPQASITPTCLLAVLKYTAALGANMLAFTPGTNVECAAYQLAGGSFYASNNSAAVTTVSGPVIGTWYRVRHDFSNQAGDIVRFGATQSTGNAGNSAPSGAGRTISGFTGGPAPVTVWDLLYLKIIPTAPQLAAYDAWLSATTGGIPQV